VIIEFERCLFNVADAVNATGWLLIQAIGIWPRLRRQVTERDVWCYWGMAGGPLFVDLLVADHAGRVDPEFPEGRLLAKKARFLVREYTADWSCRPAAAALIKEGCKLFGRCWDKVGGLESRLLDTQLAFLRMAYGLPPMKRRSRHASPEHQRFRR